MMHQLRQLSDYKIQYDSFKFVQTKTFYRNIFLIFRGSMYLTFFCLVVLLSFFYKTRRLDEDNRKETKTIG